MKANTRLRVVDLCAFSTLASCAFALIIGGVGIGVHSFSAVSIGCVLAVVTILCGVGFWQLTGNSRLADCIDMAFPTKVLPTGRLTVDPDYFMPYSECPKCKVEALHWMREPDLVAARKTRDRWLYNHNSWQRKTYYPYLGELPMSDNTRIAIAVTEGKVDVIRTCRECKHEWGQGVGVKL